MEHQQNFLKALFAKIAPIDGFKTIGGQSVVLLDEKKVPPFFAALGKDQLTSYLSPSPSPPPSPFS
jgi:hypothetical protein